MSAGSARQSQRVLIDAPVRLTLREASRTLPARALDLSEGGMRLRADAPLRVGDEVTCNLELDDERAALNGRVRWSKPSAAASGGVGLGVQFETLDEAQLGQLRRWLAHNSEHAEVVLLHVPSMREPLRTRGCVTADGLELIAALPQFAPGTELEFQLGDTGSRRIGRIERIDVKRRTEHGALELSVRLQPSAAGRSRRNLVYGLGEFESVEYAPAAARPAPPPIAASTSAPLVASEMVATDTTTGKIRRRRARVQTLQIPKTGTLRFARYGAGIAAILGLAIWVWVKAATTPTEPASVVVPHASLVTSAPRHVIVPLPSVEAPKPLAQSRKPLAQPTTSQTPTQTPRANDVISAPPVANALQPTANKPVVPSAAPEHVVTSNAPTDETRLPALNSEGAKSEIFVPMSGSLDGIRTTQWTDPLAVVLDIPGARFAAPELLRGLRGGGVKRVRLDETRPVPRLQIFLNTVAARFAAKSVPHGLLVVLEHDLQPMPH